MHKLCLFLIALPFIGSIAVTEDACRKPKEAQASASKDSPFACDRLALTPEERKRHFEELGPALVALRTGVRELADGYELEFPSDRKTYAMITEWIEQERRCCPFFNLDLHVEREGGPVLLRLTGRPGTKEFIQADAEGWIAPPRSR